MGDPARIVELLGHQTKPSAQPVAGWIVPECRFVYLATGRLPDNTQPRRSMRLHNRTRTARQSIDAVRASADILQQLRQDFGYFPRD
jgi:hypothetical protein